MNHRQKFYSIFKRVISIVGSIIGIVFCAALLWWWIFLINLFVTKGHPFFYHKRVGKNGKVFNLFKFRSMKSEVNPNLTSYEIGNEDKPNTKFGSFLRKTSLDETLQLINILTGKMCFIGPRPLIDYGEDHITIELRKKNGSIALVPGMSGYAQINGRTDISPEEKAELDGYYFKHFGLLLDVKVFIISVLQTLGLLKNRSQNQ